MRWWIRYIKIIDCSIEYTWSHVLLSNFKLGKMLLYQKSILLGLFDRISLYVLNLFRLRIFFFFWLFLQIEIFRINFCRHGKIYYCILSNWESSLFLFEETAFKKFIQGITLIQRCLSLICFWLSVWRDSLWWLLTLVQIYCWW